MGINSIKVKKIIRPLDLGDFQEEYRGTIIEVWVNPPTKLTHSLPGLLAEWQKAIAKRVLLENEEKEPKNLKEKSTEGVSEDAAQLEKPEIAASPPAKAPRNDKVLPVTREMIEHALVEEEQAKRAVYEWFSQIWEDSPIEDVMAMVEKLETEDPALLMFMRDRTVRMVNEYYVARKKA